jgi:hypothetical protein
MEQWCACRPGAAAGGRIVERGSVRPVAARRPARRSTPWLSLTAQPAAAASHGTCIVFQGTHGQLPGWEPLKVETTACSAGWPLTIAWRGRADSRRRDPHNRWRQPSAESLPEQPPDLRGSTLERERRPRRQRPAGSGEPRMVVVRGACATSPRTRACSRCDRVVAPGGIHVRRPWAAGSLLVTRDGKRQMTNSPLKSRGEAGRAASGTQRCRPATWLAGTGGTEARVFRTNNGAAS